MTKKFFLSTNWTCIRRKLDARKIADYLSKNNHKIVNDPRKADIIILVTCAFSNQRTEQAIAQIRNLKKYDAELIVAGCLPAIDPERMKAVFNGRTFVTKEIEKIDELFPENKIKFNDLEDANDPWENVDETRLYDSLKKILGKSEFIRNFYSSLETYIRKNLFSDTAVFTWYGNSSENPFFIRPSRGCLGNCSYCAIYKAIGKMKSKPFDTCVSEFKEGLSQGYKNFILDADDIGCYGMDIGSSFSQLLDEITSVPGDYQIDIHYIHPHWVIKHIEGLEKVLRTGKIRRILSSIQSGNPRILKLMHRFPDTEKLKEAYLRLKKAYPDLLLETECICGFPTETMEEFKDTLNFILEVRFGWGAFFPFSCKIGTHCESLEPKIPEDEILRRIKFAKNFLKNHNYDARYAKYSRKLSQDIIVYSDKKFMSKLIKKN